MPKVSASSGVTRPRGIGRLAVRCMQRVDVGVVPHVERAGGAGADGDAEQRDDGEHGMQLPGRQHHADQRREHDERHHARLHQRDEVADAAARGLRGAQAR